MEIIVRKGGSEPQRRKAEAARAIIRHYYGREIRDGARFKSKAGTKEQIRKVYEVRETG